MILDTNAISALGFGERAIATVVAKHSTLYVPTVVLGEYRYGILGSAKRVETEHWLNLFLSDVEILDVRQTTAIRYAVIQRALRSAGTQIPTNDAWIAALALEHDLPLLSRDAHFDAVKGLRRASW